ncbi:Asp-tRNA(Asn)/Glu-tRNA(Gln) amidotransferase GatCAB subunit A [Microvirga sp. KLBC 81]|uniref:amidase n=1 Tax=Microvirga sp. KLBC 81 TaxID=1862707 RepID=UPI000D51DE27|nr:amidase [Microvirga sp. KLBC 81]PVE22199.1 Asp-tRNA(Asn)/Glu-tRNA(Gln) amidotransferase GatCAB subunit A [Microvirga sp. KLBC 81]
MNEIAWLSAAELASAYRTRELSPVTVVEHLLERISGLDARVNVFVHLDVEGALRQAREAETSILAGRDHGPLHGIPVGIKDIIDVAGLPTTCHSRMLTDNIAKEDAECVARLRDAGAIILGKVATHEFAIGGPSFDLPYPPARNPWNLDHHPGGSSSGSGAGLAAGFFPLALGTDTGGSVRNPAGACGVIGLKPTYERVSRKGVFPLSWTLDNVGPMGRRVEDVSLFLDALTGKAHSTSRLARDIAGMRIGFVRKFHEQDYVAGPDTAAALETAANVLAELGAIVTDIELPPLQDFAAVSRTILTSEGWSIHGEAMRAHPQKYGMLSRQRLLVGAFITAENYIRARMLAAKLRQDVDDAFRGVDVLLAANAMNPACRIDDEKAIVTNYLQHARAPFNVTGHPALSMMCGLSQQGMPIAMQLIGPRQREDVVFRVAAAYERATDWIVMRPPGFVGSTC